MTKLEPYNKNSPLTWKQYLRGNLYTLIGNAVIVASATKTITDKLEQVGEKIDSGLSDISYGVERVSRGIEELKSDFNHGMSLVISRLEAQQKQLSGMLEKLDVIHKVLEAPDRTRAREFRTMGLERLSRGLLDKSLEAFLHSLEKEETDFFVQLQVGKLYLYGVDEDDDVIDIVKAEKHLRDAIRYAKADMEYLPEAKKYFTESCFHCSTSYYIQGVEKLKENKKEDGEQLLNEAISLSKKALEISPEFSEALYHCAKYYVLLNKKEDAFQYLTEAIIIDENYIEKLNKDHDFDEIAKQFEEFFNSDVFNKKIKERLEKVLKETDENVQKKFREYKGIFCKKIINKVEKIKKRYINSYIKNTYDYLQDVRICKEIFLPMELPYIISVSEQSLMEGKEHKILCLFCDEWIFVRLKDKEKQIVKCPKCANEFLQIIRKVGVIRPTTGELTSMVESLNHKCKDNVISSKQTEGGVQVCLKLTEVFWDIVKETGLSEYFKKYTEDEIGPMTWKIISNRIYFFSFYKLSKPSRIQLINLFNEFIDKFEKHDSLFIARLNTTDFLNAVKKYNIEIGYLRLGNGGYTDIEEFFWNINDEEVLLIWYFLDDDDFDIKKINNEAIKYFNGKEIEKCLNCVKEGLKISSNNVQLLTLGIKCYIFLKQWGQAKELLDVLLSISEMTNKSELACFDYYTGLVYIATDNIDKAQKYFKNPNDFTNIDILFYQGWYFYKENNIEKARDLYYKYISEKKKDEELPYINEELKEYEQKMKQLLKHMKLLGEAMELYIKKNIDGAISILEDIIKQNPKDKYAYHNLAIVYRQKGSGLFGLKKEWKDKVLETENIAEKLGLPVKKEKWLFNDIFRCIACKGDGFVFINNGMKMKCDTCDGIGYEINKMHNLLK